MFWIRNFAPSGVRRSLLALSAGSALALSAGASAQETSDTAALIERNKILEEHVRKLESRVNDLESREAHSEVSQTSRAVLSDADRHSRDSTLSTITGSYAPDVGFVIRSPDGNFSLHPGVVFDFRYMGNYRQDIPHKGGGETGHFGQDTEGGFDLTRLRLTLDGVLAKDIGYFVQFQDDQGTSFGLLDAYATYHFHDTPFTLKAGQFKDPVWHERNLSEAKQMAVDRSLTEALLGGGQGSRLQGVSLLYDKDRFRGQLVYHDGFNSSNTKFIDAGGVGAGVGGAAGVTPTNWGTSARAEYLVLGQRTGDLHPFVEYDQFTSLGAQQDILVVGGGFDYTEARGNKLFLHSFDAQYNSTSGLGLYGAYYGSYRNLNINEGVKAGNDYDPGLELQASYLLTPKVEPFVRYDYTYLAGTSVSGLNKHTVQEYTLGFNYYISRQNVKFTLDGSWLPDGSPADSDALGVLKDSGHNEFVLRAQFQLAL